MNRNKNDSRTFWGCAIPGTNNEDYAKAYRKSENIKNKINGYYFCGPPGAASSLLVFV